MQNYNAIHDLPTAQTGKAKISLENASPADILHLEQNLMSLPELTADKVISYKRMTHFAKTYYHTYIAVKMITTS